MSSAKNKMFKISFRNKSEADPTLGDDGSRVAFVEGATIAAARARLLSFVVEMENIERASPTDLAYALSGVMRGEGGRKPIVLLEGSDSRTESNETAGAIIGQSHSEPGDHDHVPASHHDEVGFPPSGTPMIGEDY